MARTILQDLQLALRRLTKTPRFAGLAILMLALALGAHLTIVSLIDTVFFKPLPLAEPDRLLLIHETRDGEAFNPLAYLDYLHYRATTKAFVDLAALYPTAPLHLDLGDTSEMLNGAIVSANYFSLLGVQPGLGRFFLPDEDATPGTHPVAVVSHSLWQSRLGGRDDVLGSLATINSTAFTVVGVAPPGFGGLAPDQPCEVWIPTMMTDVGYRWCEARTNQDCRIFEMVGRLAPGHTMEAARVEMDGLSRNLYAANPAAKPVRGLNLAPLAGPRSERGVSGQRMASLLLLVVTLVVLVAAANLSGLLVGRGLTRRREIAVRLALGAPRRRVVSLFVAEALLLALAASFGGLLVAGWAGPLAALAFSTQAPIEIQFSPTVLGYSMLLGAILGVAVGLVPGLQASRPSLVSALKDVTGQGSRRPGLLALFVIVQVAVSFVLLHSTGLLTQSLATISGAVSTEPESLATLRLRPRLVSYKPEQGQAVTREVVRRIEALPGVRSVGFGKLLPWWPGFDEAVSLPGEAGKAMDKGASPHTAGIQPIGPGTLDTVGTAVLQGRDFDQRDVAGSPPVILVNRTLAEKLWPDQPAVGERLTFGGQSHQVIGVIQDSAYHSLKWGPSSQIFTAFWQRPGQTDARLVVRAHGDASALLPALREIVHAVDPAVPVTEVASLDQRLRQRDLSQVHVVSRLTGIAGVLAVLLAAIGLSGVLALAVGQRVREIGIRRALGASHNQVMALVVRDATILVSGALGCGLLASLAMGPVLGHFLYGVSPRDPWILGSVLLLLTVVSAVASWWPARRAAQVDPIVALRQ